MRLPSDTPSASTPRSFSSSTTSAASLATSVAESTEIPTSAACSASASLTPSPRKPTERPCLRAEVISFAFCSGVTRAKIVLSATIWSNSAPSSWSICAPVTAPLDTNPISAQTFSATWGLSPVATFTSISSAASLASESRAAALGLSANVRNPTSDRPASSAGVRAVRSSAGLAATATTRRPSANRASRVRCAASGTSMHAASTCSGAPLTTRTRPPPGDRASSTSAEVARRVWSNGSVETRVTPAVTVAGIGLRFPQGRVHVVAAGATDGGVDVGGQQPGAQHRIGMRARRIRRRPGN